MIKKYSILFCFLLFCTCDNPLINPDELHCILDYKGFYDKCGVCSGGSSGHVENSDIDCTGRNSVTGDVILDPNGNPVSGSCFGNAVIDECDGICDDAPTDCNNDCNGNPNGSAFYDDCGICAGGDTGITANFNVDDCGVCGGTGDNKDLCNVCFGDNTSCSKGLLTLTAVLNFNEMHYWNNSGCSGTPFYSFYDEICVDNSCYDFDISFYQDLTTGEMKFYQKNYYSDLVFLGDWSIIGSLCLDYNKYCSGNCFNGDGSPNLDNFFEDQNSLELQDTCYDLVGFESSYYDCINNPEFCINNSVIFTNSDEIINFCSQEKYSSENIESSSNDEYIINFLPTPIYNIRLINQYLNNN